MDPPLLWDQVQVLSGITKRKKCWLYLIYLQLTSLVCFVHKEKQALYDTSLPESFRRENKFNILLRGEW